MLVGSTTFGIMWVRLTFQFLLAAARLEGIFVKLGLVALALVVLVGLELGLELVPELEPEPALELALEPASAKLKSADSTKPDHYSKEIDTYSMTKTAYY